MAFQNRMMNPFKLPELDVATLVGYQEDKAAAKRFERRFMIYSFPAIILIFGSPAAMLLGKISEDQVFAPLLTGFALLIGVMFWMFRSEPVSASGRPMKRYWNLHPKPGHNEAIYVCEESRTYFIRVWGKPSGRKM